MRSNEKLIKARTGKGKQGQSQHHQGKYQQRATHENKDKQRTATNGKDKQGTAHNGNEKWPGWDSAIAHNKKEGVCFSFGSDLAAANKFIHDKIFNKGFGK